VQPKPVDLLTQELVSIGTIDGGELPVVVRPNAPEVDLADWAAAHRDLIDEKLRRHGAALFRGFGIGSAREFEAFARAVCPDLYGEYGDLPKADVGDLLYRSTPYPPDKTILFHNESSHTPRWPLRQFFYCVKASRTGGETPIVDCRALYRGLTPELRERFTSKGLLYVRNFTPGFDVSWQDFFKTADREVVERCCRDNSIGFEWRDDGGLRIRQGAPAAARHPQTGEMVFFNQVQLHHVAYLEAEVRESLLSLFSEEGLPRNVYFGDGTPIEDEVIAQLSALYWQTSVSFPWQDGDVLVLDNMLVAHARNPFEGERKILVAMGQMFERQDLEPVA
jgi:alpha-ketoglutarate-dependent taurine dioxygenase